MQPRPSRLLRRKTEHGEQSQGKNTQPAARTPTPRPRRRRADVRASAAVGGVRGGALSRTGAGPQRAVGVGARSRQVREAERQGPVAGLIAAQKKDRF